MKIPFHRPSIGEEECSAVLQCLKSGWLTMGEETFIFEKEFSSFIGVPHAVAVNSCTAALHLAFRSIGLSPGDEVIIPDISFISSDEAVRYFKARPVLVDVERETHCIDVSKIESAITKKTRAIMPVHFGGQPADMDEVMALARDHGITVIDDAAHALPATYKGNEIGSIGDITCFSFYATKTLTTGEGGMATTSNEEWAESMRRLRLHGIDRDAWKRYRHDGSWYYDVAETGYKYNTTDINAAMGREQLKKARLFLQKRKAIARAYTDNFEEREELIPCTVKKDRESAWHLYPLKLNLEALVIDRDEFIVRLGERGVSASVHFIPLSRFSINRGLYGKGDFPTAEWVFERSLSLPIYPDMTAEETEYVIESVLDVTKRYRR